MPQILPIRGLRYTPAAGRPETLLAPPYDVISETERQRLADRSPYNAVRLELASGGEERYAMVAGLLQSWLDLGAVQRDEAPMLYVYEQEFDEGGIRFRRRALIAGVEAQPWEEGAVKPHEFTMSGPKEDRLKLLSATRTQLSPVFMIARDRAGQLRDFIETTIRSRPADMETPAPDVHRMWAIEAGRYEMRHIAPLLSESFYIADGHHRYETSVTYKQSLVAQEATVPRDHPARFAMTAIVAADDPGLVIRSIHRLVPRTAPANWRELLSPLFEIENIDTAVTPEAIEAALASGLREIIAAGLDSALTRLRLRRAAGLAERLPAGRSEAWGAIMPNVVRYGVLEPLWSISDDEVRAGAVTYSHDPAEILARRGDGVGLFINPVGIGEVMTLADQGERMPQKSTFFFPKLATGLVFHPLYP